MKTIIIAEVGVNHNGYLKNAFQLIKEAKSCGADFVKFQIFKSEKQLFSLKTVFGKQ